MYSLILAYFFWAILNDKNSASQKDSVENIRKRSYATDTEKDAAEDKKMVSPVREKRYAPSASKFGMGQKVHFQI